jgi:hypothetical protein
MFPRNRHAKLMASADGRDSRSEDTKTCTNICPAYEKQSVRYTIKSAVPARCSDRELAGNDGALLHEHQCGQLEACSLELSFQHRKSSNCSAQESELRVGIHDKQKAHDRIKMGISHSMKISKYLCEGRHSIIQRAAPLCGY